MVVWRDIGGYMYPRRREEDDKLSWVLKERTRADTIICVAGLLEVPGATFTVVQYTGPNARKVHWPVISRLSSCFKHLSGRLSKKTSGCCRGHCVFYPIIIIPVFLTSHSRTSSVSQIYGYNNIPSLILHNGRW